MFLSVQSKVTETFRSFRIFFCIRSSSVSRKKVRSIFRLASALMNEMKTIFKSGWSPTDDEWPFPANEETAPAHLVEWHLMLRLLTYCDWVLFRTTNSQTKLWCNANASDIIIFFIPISSRLMFKLHLQAWETRSWHSQINKLPKTNRNHFVLLMHEKFLYCRETTVPAMFYFQK